MNIFKYRVLNHIIFWIFIYVFYSMPFVILSGKLTDAFVNLMLLPIDILTVYFVIEYLIPEFLLKKRRIFTFLLGIVVAISVNIFLGRLIMYNLHPLLGLPVVRRPFTVEMFYALLTNFMIVGLASAMKLLRYSYNIQLTQSELERRAVQSELNTLRSQVNPHFLFNVLNNIDSLIFVDKEKASAAIFQLSKIMRYMLQESSEEKVRVDKELAYIQDYLKLAELSFQDPAFLEYKVSGSNPGKQIPPLLFIPIIENAVKHGNKQSEAPGIRIEFDINSDYIKLKTRNYVKRNNFKLPDSYSGTGLKNVEKRLKLLYKDNYSFEINSNKDTFEVYLKVPYL